MRMKGTNHRNLRVANAHTENPRMPKKVDSKSNLKIFPFFEFDDRNLIPF